VQFRHVDDLSWHEPPGHVQGFSKYLVEGLGSRYFDFRLSRYPSGGCVQPHQHEIAEHVYYFIEGTGTADCGDERLTVGPGTVMFVRPGVRHSVVSTGDGDLVFVVATSPPSDIPR
jgi:mannose-6-phosphate isomerase-like protein (cupin superfamily)